MAFLNGMKIYIIDILTCTLNKKISDSIGEGNICSVKPFLNSYRFYSLFIIIKTTSALYLLDKRTFNFQKLIDCPYEKDFTYNSLQLSESELIQGVDIRTLRFFCDEKGVNRQSIL